VSEGDIDKLMKNVMTKQTFILDLRRNGGGLVDTLKYFLRYFFNKDVKIATEKKRSESREVWVKANGEKKFGGRVLLLVDSRSASASEVFARVMQLEKRGVVFGDRTAGAVMESVRFVQSLVPRAVGGLGDFIPYGASITIADLEMTDGNSLEKTGLIPDQVVLKRRADFLSGSDPVLSSALSSIGLTVSPLDAGKIFPPDVDLEFE
jgi:carboxyl-terminal processing protease